MIHKQGSTARASPAAASDPTPPTVTAPSTDTQSVIPTCLLVVATAAPTPACSGGIPDAAVFAIGGLASVVSEVSRVPKRIPAGVRVRHSRSCASRAGGRCDCSPTFEAAAYAKRDGKKVRKTFTSLGEARRWRTAMLKLADDGGLRKPAATTFRDAATLWLDQARAGAIRTKSGDVYKPSALRGYEQALRLRLLPPLRAHRLSDVARADLQRLVSVWQEAGLSPSSIRNTINAVRAIYRSADLLVDGAIPASPTVGLRLPAVRGRRERIASPDEGTQLLRALPSEGRALWATALYAGLRLGELRALHWDHVDLAGGTIAVKRSYDPKVGFVEPKSRAVGAGCRCHRCSARCWSSTSSSPLRAWDWSSVARQSSPSIQAQ